jgi:hypothetical protein
LAGFLLIFCKPRKGEKEKKFIPLEGGKKIIRQSHKVGKQTCACKIKRIPFLLSFYFFRFSQIYWVQLRIRNKENN